MGRVLCSDVQENERERPGKWNQRSFQAENPFSSLTNSKVWLFRVFDAEETGFVGKNN